MSRYIGTSGYSYKWWHSNKNLDCFYPDMGNEFETYVKHFNTVEINTTFYALPSKAMCERWLNSPTNFVFSVKVWQQITHYKKLINIEEHFKKFVDAISIMLPKIRVLLFQMPPNFKLTPIVKQRLVALKTCIDLNNVHSAIVFEFRDPSWYCEDIYELFKEYRWTISWNHSRLAMDDTCVYNSLRHVGLIGQDLPGFTPFIVSNMVYIRLHGVNCFGSYSDKFFDDMRGLLLAYDLDGVDIFVYFNNTDGLDPNDTFTGVVSNVKLITGIFPKNTVLKETVLDNGSIAYTTKITGDYRNDANYWICDKNKQRQHLPCAIYDAMRLIAIW